MTCQDHSCLCPELTSLCGAACIDILNDPKNCGSCGTTCSNLQSCVSGQCTCPTELNYCDGTCLDLRSNAQHCGRCGNTCEDKEVCSDGECVRSCPADKPALCQKGCVDTNKHFLHFGNCNTACKRGQTCHNGRCDCPVGWINCGEGCVDLRINRKHCGKCKKACNKGQICSEGACRSNCPKETPVACFGGCVDTSTHSQHCGECGKACTRGKICSAGQCVCPADKENCGGKCIDLRTHFEHCGACSKPCSEGQRCSDGRCISSCPKGTPNACFGGCFDKEHSDHCGRCGNACKKNQLCKQGACLCEEGLQLCQGSCVNTRTDPIHCGTCSNLCKQGEVCEDGTCKASCTTEGLTLCHRGCVDLQKDRYHCGACGIQCPPEAQCSGGRCVCEKGSTLCTNRCVNLQTHHLHCGACGIQCGRNELCTSGKCVRQCPPENPNCNGGINKDKETCNGRDDNGDGKVDEPWPNKGQACTIKTKDCERKGVYQCKKDGTGVECIAQGASSKPELCNDLDDNCDGQIDESFPKKGQKCTKQNGSCKAEGKYICSKDGKYVECNAAAHIGTEKCDGQDNDCDGQVDEDLTAPPCAKKEGVCKGAKKVCGGKKGWLPCDTSTYSRHASAYAQQEGVTHCDGLDNDCDGRVDNLSALLPCPRQKGACLGSYRTCLGTKGWSNGCTDLDYRKNNPYYSAKEDAFQCDGRDNDCNGQTDENCSCKEGSTQPCYSGKPGTKGKAACKSGIQTCSNKKWSPCVGEVLPGKETCDGKDNDCNGKVDEVCTCKTGQTQSCYTGVPGTSAQGLCKKGQQICVNGYWGSCTGEVTPAIEECDGKDNNCNGQVDEAFSGKGSACQLSTPGLIGACAKGITICDSGKRSCKSNHQKSTETCNGKDDDCNGKVDDNLKAPPCNKQSGVCKGSTQSCGGVKGWLPCDNTTYLAHSSRYLKKEELVSHCDKLDNDCDGKVDNALTRPCKTLCGTGTQTCKLGAWEACSSGVPAQEICDGKDNDCDGKVDGMKRSCRGACGQGNELCSAGKWSTCKPLVTYKEVCDGKDNDCNGQIDENVTKDCYSGTTGTAGIGECKNGKQYCTGGSYGICLGAIGPAKNDLCNNKKDDNCNGTVDEGCGQVYQITGTQSVTTSAIAVDKSGNVYIAGSSTKSFTIGTTVVIGMFLAKMDITGKFVWAIRSSGSISGASPHALAIDPQGNVVMSGTLRAYRVQVSFGGKSMGGYSPSLIFISKISSSGKVLWHARATGSYSSGSPQPAKGLAIDKSGNIYVATGYSTGRYSTNVDAGATRITLPGYTSAAILLKLNSSGTHQWAQHIIHGRGLDTAVDASGNIYFSGSITRSTKIGGSTYSALRENAFVSKLNTSGTFIWTNLTVGDRYSNAQGLRVRPDSSGNVYLYGMWRRSMKIGAKTYNTSGIGLFITKLNSNGLFSWVALAGGTNATWGLGQMRIDAKSNLYISGEFTSGSIRFGSPLHVVQGSYDGFLAKLDNNGKFTWAISTAGSGRNGIQDCALDTTGKFIWTTGPFSSSTKFGATTLPLQTKVRSGSDLFVWKIENR